MTEYKIGNATVRISGSYDSDKLKTSSINFLKKAEMQRKRCQKRNKEENQQGKSASC